MGSFSASSLSVKSTRLPDSLKIRMIQGLGLAAAGQEAAPALGLGFLLSLQLRSENPGQAANILGRQKVAFHEPLDAELLAAILIAHARSDLRLQIKTQALFRPAGNKVKVTPHGPKEPRGPQEDVVFVPCKHL